MRRAIRWFICATVCLLITASAIADDSYAVFGTVATKTGAPLEGVRVSFSGWLEAQVTDADGKFRIEGALPDMAYEVTPTLTGHIFKPERRAVLISSGDERADFVGRVEDSVLAAMGVTPAAAAPPASKAGPDAYEADNRWERAKGIGRHETQTHNIHASWDVDWATFTLPWRGNVVISTDGVAGDTLLSLYGPDDPTLLVSLDDDSGAGDFSRMRWPEYYVQQPGRYWIRVQEDGQDATINSYTLSLNATEAAPCRVIYPNAEGITWEPGGVQTIRWTGFNGDLADIVLLKGGRAAVIIASDTANDGSFVWRVEPSLAPGTDYRIGITTNGATSRVAWSDNEFEIVPVPLVTHPSAAGLSFARGTELAITWLGFVGPDVRIELYQAGVFLQEIEASTPNDGEWADTIPADFPLAANYRIRVVSLADSGLNDMSDYNFAIVANSQVTYPSDEGIVWRRDGSYSVTWEDFTSPTVRIELFHGATLDRTLTAGTPNDGVFWWRVPADMPLRDDYKIRVSAPSKAPDDDMSDFPFAVALPPKVLYPSAAGIEIGRGVDVEVTWRGYSGTHVRIDLYQGGVFADNIAASVLNDGSYVLTTPSDAEIRDDYRIGVTSLAVPTETDRSNNDFAVVANPRVTAPTAAGLAWEIGDMVNINWADFGSAQVRIQLYKGATLNRTITRATPNDGRFLWRIPPEQDRGDDFRIRVVSGDDWGEFDFSNNYFAIAPAPVVLYPSAPGITWRQGTTYTITWRDFPGANVGITLYRGLAIYKIINLNTPNDGAYVWRLPDTIPPDDNYEIAVYTTSGHIVNDHSDNRFTVEAGPHVITPNGGEVWYAGDAGHITWERFPGANVKLRLYRDGVFARTISSSTPDDGSFWWSVPGDLPNAGDYRVRINSLSDTSQWDQSNAGFVITNLRPRVTYPSVWGIEWTHGDSVQIRWENYLGAQVLIQLRKGGAFERVISASTPNDGSFWWRVPADVAGGSDYRIRIVAKTNDMEDTSNNDFTVINVPTVLYPSASGVTTRRTMAMPITWEGFSGGTVNIRLFRGGIYQSTIEAGAANDGYTIWAVPSAQILAPNYTIMIQGVADPTELDSSDNDFEILARPT